VLLAVFLVGGCGGAGSPPAAPVDPGPVRPAAGGEPLVVDSLPIEAPMVLDPIPAGLHVRELEIFAAGPGPDPFRTATLYGDPSLADTLDGPVLLVGRSSGSASIGGPPCCEGRTVDLGDREGLLVHEADRTWVNIDPGRPDYVEFVVGRGIPDDALITAAAGAGFGTDMAPETATLAPQAVPPGLEPLVVGAPADGPFTAGAGEVIVLDGESTTIHISAVRAAPRLAALWGFWTDDAAGTLVRGQPGSLGELHGSYVGNPGRAYVWAENGLVLSVISTGDGHEYLDEVVQNLRVGTLAEFEGMRRAAIDRVPTAAEVGCTNGTVVTAVDGDLRWGFGLQADTHGPGTWSDCTKWFTLTSASPGTSGSFTLPPLGQIAGSVVGGSLNDGLSGSVVGGVVPPGTARVTVLPPDGRTLEALLGDPGPRPGERIFGTFARDVVWGPGSPPYVVTAYDSTGAVLATQPVQ
jgi:hypothetical protein